MNLPAQYTEYVSIKNCNRDLSMHKTPISSSETVKNFLIFRKQFRSIISMNFLLEHSANPRQRKRYVSIIGKATMVQKNKEEIAYKWHSFDTADRK
jgi:hypothetical protein